MKSALVLVPFVVLAVAAGEAREVGAGGSLDPALANPPATGLLVLRVLPGTPAERNGLAEGDVIVSLGGVSTPDRPAWDDARALAAGEETVSLDVVRADESLTVTFEPGRLGLQLLPVVKGERVEPLPPPTGVVLDFSGFGARTRESWFVFRRAGKKAGFGRVAVARVGDQVWVTTERVRRGDGETDLLDQEATLVFTASTEPRPLLVVFRDRRADRTRIASMDRAGAAPRSMTLVTTGPGEVGRTAVVPLPRGVLPASALETLVTAMPRREGACLRFAPLVEARGEAGPPAALVAVGRETGEEGGTVWRYDWIELGAGVVASFRVDGAGRLASAGYGPVRAIRTTREEALAGQPADIAARIRK